MKGIKIIYLNIGKAFNIRIEENLLNDYKYLNIGDQISINKITYDIIDYTICLDNIQLTYILKEI